MLGSPDGFCRHTATIVAGAVAERMKITVIWLRLYHWRSGLSYLWEMGLGGGWLSTLDIMGTVGVKDFAGSGVVHAVGGLAAFIGAAMVGPRIGKFNKDGTPNVIRGHNIPYIVIGTFILFFGWFGFNPGSTLAATDLRISVIAVNTFLAAVAGAIVALYWTFVKTGKMDIVMGCNGALAGLVAITAPCAYVAPWAAVVIGAIAAPVLMGTAYLVERVFKVDDAVGAVPVHLGGGVWGLLAVGIFADGTYGGVSGLITGSVAQLILQIIDIAVLFAWVTPTMLLTFWIIKKTIGLRVSKKEELQGLDIPEHGMEAYPMDPDAIPAGAGVPGIAYRKAADE
jgi:Amt family ammonium transporter